MYTYVCRWPVAYGLNVYTCIDICICLCIYTPVYIEIYALFPIPLFPLTRCLFHRGVRSSWAIVPRGIPGPDKSIGSEASPYKSSCQFAWARTWRPVTYVCGPSSGFLRNAMNACPLNDFVGIPFPEAEHPCSLHVCNIFRIHNVPTLLRLPNG